MRRECDYNSYAKLLSATLNEVVNKTNPETITWKDDRRKFEKLQIIKKLGNRRKRTVLFYFVTNLERRVVT